MSLMAWYPFDGNAQNYGVGSLSLTQTTAPIYSAGKLCDKALANGGFKWTAAQTASVLNNEAITIAFWIKPLNTASGQIFGTDGMNPPNNRKFSIFAWPTGNDLHWSWQNDGSSTFVSEAIKGCLPTNTWTHVCITYQNPKGKVFINGIEKSTFSGVSASTSFFYETQVIHNSANRLIQDFRVYNHCLSPREVNQLSQGLVLHYKLNGCNNSNILTNSYKLNGKSTSIDPILNCPVVNADNSTGTSYKDFVYWSGLLVNANEVYTVSFYAKSTSSSVLTMYFYNNASGIVQVANIKSSEGHNKTGIDGNCPLKLTPQWKKYWVTWTFNAATTSANKTLLFRLAAGGKCDVALPKLEKGAIATPYGLTLQESKVNLAQDSSGYNHHGTTVGNLTLSSDSRRYSNSCVFDGSTTGINLPIKDLMKRLLNDKCSINFWVNEADISNRSVYFGGYNGSNFNIEMNGGRFRVYWGGSPDIQTSSVVNNTWTMFTVTIDKETGIKIYKDSVLVYTYAAALIDIASNFTRDFNIGKDSRTDSTMMEGKMSDFRIYASVLTQDAIDTLYKAAISMTENATIQAYEFNEEPDVFNIKAYETGAIKSADISEIGYVGGMKIKVLEDNSVWARIHWLDVTTDKIWFKDANEVAFCNKANRFSRMGLVDHLKRNLLPKGYTKLAYIESTGTQYIDTGFVPNQNTKINITYQHIDIFGALFGARVLTTSSVFGAWIQSDCIFPHYGNTSYNAYPISINTNNKFTFTLNKNIATVGTLSSTSPTATFDSTYNLTLLAINSGGAVDSRRPKGYLYACQIYDNDILVRNFIPCKNPQGNIGLYDSVQNIFYASAEGTAFIAGPVSTEADEYEFMLTYPRLSTTNYNRWSQTSSPNSSTVTGLNKITTAWDDHNGGIRKHGSSCLYNCDTGSTWFAPIGQYNQWADGQYIPAANGSSQTETELWVRIDNLPLLNKISMLDDKYIQAFNIYEI